MNKSYIKYIPIVAHVLTAICCGLYFFSDINLSKPNNYWQILENTLLLLMFYIHALVLVPQLLKKRNINKYVFLTFALFALGAVCFAIFSVAARKDYIYVFTLIFERGVAYDDDLIQLYEKKYIFSLTAFGLSFLYGYSTTQVKNKLRDLFSHLFKMRNTEVLIHVVLLIVLFISSYFQKYFQNNFLISSLFLFYFHMLYTSQFLLKDKKIRFFLLLTIIEFIPYFILISFFNQIQNIVILTTGITIITFATIYSFVKKRFNDQVFLFTKADNELRHLKSQINPHFLFNSLNTLYSFAIKENAENTAANIKKFSNIIRFTLKDLDNNFIPLENEIGYIKDFIEIQVARCPIKQNIKLDFTDSQGYQIAPMMLIPFVENAFKHGINPIEESTLVINLRCKDGVIYFECTNSISKQTQNAFQKENFGIGIDNVKSRLALIYPENHYLSIVEEDDLFKIKLEIYDKGNNNR